MKKKNIIIIIVLILLLVGGGLAFWFLTNEALKNSDAYQFKEEYESLNNTVRDSDGASYNNVDIPIDNPIKYIDVKEALDVLNSKEAIIYVGANWCPWCRNAVPVLFDVCKDYKVDTVYYLNLDNDKSAFEIKDDDLVKTKDGSKEYYELLDKLDDVLEEYTLTSQDGKVYNTGEKRIYMPFVIGIKDGKVVSNHTGTVTLDENQSKYDKLTTSQYEELYNTYTNLLSSVYGSNTCTNESLCD